ncbi:MAG: hypothetical protein AAGJ08_12315 [Cyanobacteria bacterium P01_H01_bin.35]
MVDDLLPKDAKEPVKVKTSLVKVRGKTIIYGNSIYQINNITSLSFVDLTTEKKVTKQFFIYYLISLFIGIVLLLVPDITARILGLLILGVDIWLFIKHQGNKITERYGMLMVVNSGEQVILVSSSPKWIIEVIVELCDVMNTDKLKSLNLNFDNHSIDRSINVDKSIGSNFVSGEVGGDVVSSID